MYGPLWRLLPGPWPAKALASLILALAVVAACFVWLFPAVAPFMPFNDNSVQTNDTSGQTTSTPGPTSTTSTSPTTSTP